MVLQKSVKTIWLIARGNKIILSMITANGKLSDERFDMLSRTYEAEQKELEADVFRLEKEIYLNIISLRKSYIFAIIIKIRNAYTAMIKAGGKQAAVHLQQSYSGTKGIGKITINVKRK